MLELRKDIFADERDDNLKEIGKPTQRQDMIGHVTGNTAYFDDHKLAGLLHLKVRAQPASSRAHPPHRYSEAERMPGVRRVIRGADVPRNLNTLLSLLNFGKDDEPTLATDKVRYKGEPVVAIIAETRARGVRSARASVRVDYEPLPPVFDVEEALKPGAPVVNETYPKNTFEYHGKYDHQKLRFGDVEQAFAQADHVLEQRYQMSPIEHAPTETNGAIAAPETNGPLRRLHLRAGAVLLARHRGEDPRRRHPTSCISSAARSAAASAARSIRSPSRWRSSAPC